MTPSHCMLTPPTEGTAFMKSALQRLPPTAPYSWRTCMACRSRPAWERSTACQSHPAPSALIPLNLTRRHLQEEGSPGPWGQRAAPASRSCPPRRALWRRTVALQEKTQIPLPAARNTPSRSSRNRGNKGYMNYWLSKLFDCIPLVCFWKKVLGFFNGEMMAQVVAVASVCRYDTYSEKLDCRRNQLFSFIRFFGQCWICGGMGRFVYWNVKYYLFCRKLCQAQRETCLPVGFFLSCSTIYNIFACLHFCLTDIRML